MFPFCYSICIGRLVDNLIFSIRLSQKACTSSKTSSNVKNLGDKKIVVNVSLVNWLTMARI